MKRHLPAVLDALCRAGADVNDKDEKGCCALWLALESGQEDIASILVCSYLKDFSLLCGS